MVARAYVLVDTEAGANDPVPGLHLRTDFRLDATLAGKLAFTIGDDHLQPATLRCHGIAQGADDLRHRIGAHVADPFDPHPTQGALDVLAVGLERTTADTATLHRRRDRLVSGGGGVAVVHDHQHAIIFIEDGVGDTAGQAVVPESAVSHDGDNPPFHVRPDAGGTRQPKAVSQHRIADIEGRQGGEGMTADIR